MEDRGETKEVTIESGATVSSSFALPRRDSFVGVHIPDIDAGNVTIETSIDGGSTFIPILDIVDGEDLVICNSGADPGYIDISDVLKALQPKTLIRFVTAAQSTLRTLTITFRF